MSAREIIAEFGRNADEAKRFLEKKLPFQGACDLVFHENRELLALLAK